MWPGNTTNLRPLGVGERIDAAIKIVRANFLTLAKAALAVAVPSGIVVAIISVSIRSSQQSALSTPGTLPTGSLYTVAGGDFLTLVITFIVSAFVTAVCFRIIINSYLGQPAGWREALRFGWSRLGAVLWISFLTYLIVAVAGAAVAALVAVCLVVHLRALGTLLAVVLGLGASLAAIWFLTAARLAVPVMMLEDIRGRRAIARSVRLCRGFWWSVFGTQFLAGLLVAIASLAVDLVIGVIFAAFHGATPAAIVEDFISQTINYAVFAPFSAAILVVLTVDLRVRKEGFDIRLLSERMGLPPTESALFFTKPTPGGYAPPGYPPQGWPSAPPPTGPVGTPPQWPQGGGYPAPPVYPPPIGRPPEPQAGRPSYPPPAPGDRWPPPGAASVGPTGGVSVGPPTASEPPANLPPPEGSDRPPPPNAAVPSWPRPSPPKQTGPPSRATFPTPGDPTRGGRDPLPPEPPGRPQETGSKQASEGEGEEPAPGAPGNE